MAINKETLREIGLTDAQITLYLALLKQGITTTGPLIKQTNLPNSVVYNTLNQLMTMGLVSFNSKGKRKYFYAANPKRLEIIVADRLSKVKILVKDLSQIYKEKQPEQNAQVFTGWKGIYTAFLNIFETLPTGSEYIGFAAGFSDEYTPEVKRFFKEFQKKRAGKKYKVKLIVNENDRDQIKEFGYYKNFGKPFYRYVPNIAPKGLIIFGNNILQASFEDPPMAVIITSKKIAQSYKLLFESLWKIGKN